MPARVKGIELAHTVLCNGEPVRAAGQAEVAKAGKTIFGMEINIHSGHYKPPVESEIVGRNAFGSAGITFPK